MAACVEANNGRKPSSVARNTFSISSDHAVILAPHKRKTLHEVRVDLADLERVLAAGFWRVVNCDPSKVRLYAYCKIDGKVIYLHRFIMDAPHGLMVDHGNHDGLDDRRFNLTICTHSRNMLNRKGAAANSKSGFRGVDWYASRSKWRARVRTKGNNGLLGYFNSPEEADAAVQARLVEMGITTNGGNANV